MNQTPTHAGLQTKDIQPLDMSRPVAEQIASRLRGAILSMRLVPGQMLSESEVAQLFNASRTPVREAFAKLRAGGLIETRPSRGTFVSMLSEPQIRSAQFLREALETHIVRRLCQDGLAQDAHAALEDNLSKQQRAAALEDKASFQTLDDQFHILLADATGFEGISSVLTREKTALDRLRVLPLDYSARMSQLLSEHREIFEAIQSGDESKAISTTQHHLSSILKVLLKLIESNQEYFKP